MNKAIIISHYLKTLGGGENYALNFADFLLQSGWQVDLAPASENLTKAIFNRFGLRLDRANFLKTDPAKLSLWEKINFFRQYDLSFYFSDGSLPALFAKKNILHFQVPFHGVNKTPLLNKLKSKTINEVICNSFFTKKFIDREFSFKSKVIYPPVNIKAFAPGKKEKIILSVGRFTDLLHNKRQDLILQTLGRRLPRGWRLVFAGASKEGPKLLKTLKKAANGLPVEILPDLPFAQIKNLYARTSLFVAATGFGLDENKQPEKMEHFGITTVEAMAAGCIPVVIAKGGQKEIVKNNQSGFLWQTPAELLELIDKLTADPVLRKKISAAAILGSQIFSRQEFAKAYEKIIR